MTGGGGTVGGTLTGGDGTAVSGRCDRLYGAAATDMTRDITGAAVAPVCLLPLTVYFHVSLQVLAAYEGLVADGADVRPLGGLPRACQRPGSPVSGPVVGSFHSRVEVPPNYRQCYNIF